MKINSSMCLFRIILVFLFVLEARSETVELNFRLCGTFYYSIYGYGDVSVWVKNGGTNVVTGSISFSGQEGNSASGILSDTTFPSTYTWGKIDKNFSCSIDISPTTGTRLEFGMKVTGLRMLGDFLDDWYYTAAPATTGSQGLVLTSINGPACEFIASNTVLTSEVWCEGRQTAVSTQFPNTSHSLRGNHNDKTNYCAEAIASAPMGLGNLIQFQVWTQSGGSSDLVYDWWDASLAASNFAPNFRLQNLGVRSATTNATTFPGGTARLTVNMTGQEPFTYQWYQSGSAIVGATSNVLMISNVVANLRELTMTANNPQGSMDGPSLGVTVTPVAAWGSDLYGQCDVPVEATNAIQIAGGRWHTVALKKDGTVCAWGSDYAGETHLPADLTNVASVAAGTYFTAALLDNGSVRLFGDNSYGVLNCPTTISDFKSIAAGQYHCLGLRSNGTVVAWGRNSYGQTNVPTDVTGVQAVSAGYDHSLALLTNGTVRAWGTNNCGQCDVPPDLSNVVAIVAGDSANWVLKRDGRVVTWGDNSYGQTNMPVDLTNVVALAGYAHCIALKSDGTVVVWGGTGGLDYGQTNAPAGLSNVVSVAGVGRHCVALVKMPEVSRALDNIIADTDGVHISMQTEGGKNYTLEYSASLTSTNWLPVQTLSGNGLIRKFSDTSARDRQRFYRVQITQ